MVDIVLVCSRITFLSDVVERDSVPRAMAIRADVAETGRQLWADLHKQESPTQEWFDDWLSRVPNFGCSCRKDFAEYLKTNPPRFDDFYVWSVEAHNWTNKKLNKPIWNPLDSSNAIA